MRWDWIGPVLVALIIAGSLFYYGKADSDCDKAGGELMRDAMGFYKCIDAEVVK